jgi:cation/acetate symporter
MRLRVLNSFLLGTIILLGILGLLERLGLSSDLVTRLLFALLLVSLLFSGIRARSVRTTDMFVDGYRMTPLPNGLAMAMIATGALGYSFWPGDIFANQLSGFIVPLGVVGGIALMGALFVPFLRRADVLTPLELLQLRFNSRILLFLATCISAAAISCVLVGQISFLSELSARFTTVPANSALIVILAGVSLPLVLGGMRAASWLQMTMAVLVGFGFLMFLAWIALDLTGLPMPHLSASDAWRATRLLQEDAVARELARPSDVNWLEIMPTDWRAVSLGMVGVALGVSVFPPLLARAQTTRTAKESDTSIGWALVFMLALICTLPVYAIFLKFQITQSITGLSVNGLAREAPFLFSITSGLSLCGVPVSTLQEAISACGEGHRLTASDLQIPPMAFMTALPDIIVGLGRPVPQTMAAMLACGALAAIVAVVSACLISLSHHLALDLYAKFLGTNSPMSRIVFLVRLSVVVVAAGTYWLLTWPPLTPYLDHPERLILSGFALAAGGLFPSYLLAIWIGRSGKLAAIGAMLVGIAVTVAMLGVLFGLDQFDRLSVIVLPFIGETYPVAAAGLPGAIAGLATGILLALMAPGRAPDIISARLSGQPEH